MPPYCEKHQMYFQSVFGERMACVKCVNEANDRADVRESRAKPVTRSEMLDVLRTLDAGCVNAAEVFAAKWGLE